jgi:hypothetical protein
MRRCATGRNHWPRSAGTRLGTPPGPFALLRLWQRRLVKTSPPSPRGYFAIGVEGISKPVNLGNLLRSAHAFGASFVFTIGADARAFEMRADTSKAETLCRFIIGEALPSLPYPKAAAWSGSRSSMRRLTSRASPTRCGRPMCLAPSAGR